MPSMIYFLFRTCLKLIRIYANLFYHYSKAATEVLNEALQFKSELDKATEAQKGAEKSIEKVGADVVAADTDLKQVIYSSSQLSFTKCHHALGPVSLIPFLADQQ